jgi:uncharacterized membrane protein YraQ (UPF0718 family)
MPKKEISKSVLKAAKSLWNVLPLILGTILLVSLVINLIPKSFYLSVFEGNFMINSVIGGLIGSISAGTPITSYIIGGELLESGISLIAVTAFLVAWVTVGIVQLPAESAILGKRFAFLRNITAFFLAIIIALIIGLIFKII